jgi:hypothetical protein
LADGSQKMAADASHIVYGSHGINWGVKIQPWQLLADGLGSNEYVIYPKAG